MLDLGKLVGKSVTPAEITIDGITLTGNNSSAGFVPNKVTITQKALTDMVKDRLEHLGIKGMRLDVTFDCKPVDHGESAEFTGVLVTVTKVDGPGGGRM